LNENIKFLYFYVKPLFTPDSKGLAKYYLIENESQFAVRGKEFHSEESLKWVRYNTMRSEIRTLRTFKQWTQFLWKCIFSVSFNDIFWIFIFGGQNWITFWVVLSIHFMGTIK